MRYSCRRYYNAGHLVAARIAGIPCLINVHHFIREPDTQVSPGYTDVDYTICDRRGYPARWLERKLIGNHRERDRLEEHLVEQLS